MNMVNEIFSLNELHDALSKGGHTFLLLYKKGSPLSDCAHEHYLSAADEKQKVQCLKADVLQVRDIHPEFEIQSVPVLLEFSDGLLKNMIKGCQQHDFYSQLFDHQFYTHKAEQAGKLAARVLVYSTPSCSWCTTL